MKHTRAQTEDRGHPVVAALLDAFMWSLRDARRDLIPLARGRVLEIGVGTGGNLPHYRDVDSITGIDPDPHMLRRAHKRAAKVDLPIELQQLGAEALPFPDASFDTVVATWVLCTIPDPQRALAEMRRVLEPHGQLLFAEHTLSRFPATARMQHRLTPLWSRCAAGCRLDRDSLALIRQAEFRAVEVRPVGRERFTLTPVYAGSARA
jgi:ubiquinone/menaquinone biosynthesis C-methylase UbiE